VYNTDAGFANCTAIAVNEVGFTGCGNVGLEGHGKAPGSSGIGVLGYVGAGQGEIGVLGLGPAKGVSGEAESGGTGVYGTHEGDTGIGVWGDTDGTGSGVYGEATPNGVGVVGQGGPVGVSGNGTTYGVEGSSGIGGTGVYGHNSASTGIGVWGKMGGVGTGVYGQATANGVGVFGDGPVGTGVWARSTNGTALNVTGKATFSRSGVVTVAEGTSSKTVTLAGVTTSSMVLATAQQSKATHVKAAVPGAGSFTIRLTAKAPVGGLKVAFFVLN
jgi:hypothetical protein